MIIGVDVDNVLCCYNEALAEIVAAQRMVPVTSLPECDTWGFANWGFKTDGEFKYFHRILMDEGYAINIKAKENASAVLQRLISKGHHIRIITQRASTVVLGRGFDHNIAQDTIAWLNENSIPFHDIVFIDDKTQVYTDIMIDDSPHHLASFRAAGKNYLTMDYLFNRHIEGPRVKNWLEIEEYINGQGNS